MIKDEKTSLEVKIMEYKNKTMKIRKESEIIENEIRKTMKSVFKEHFEDLYTVEFIGEPPNGFLIWIRLYNYFRINIEYIAGKTKVFIDSGEKIDIEIAPPVEYNIETLPDLFEKVKEELLLRIEDSYLNKYIYIASRSL